MTWRLRRQLTYLACISLTALTASVAGAQDSVAAGATPITLSAAVRLARQNSPQTVGARGAETANRAAVRAAYGAFIPNITASVGSGRQFTSAGTTTRINQNGERVTVAGNTWTYSNGLAFNAQLFNADRLPNLRAAKADVSTAQQNTVVESYAVTVSVEQQFYAALAARESEDAARAQLAEAQQQLDASRRRVIAGVATASDSLRATVQVLTAQLALTTAQNSRRDANAALTRLVGSTTPLAAAIDDPAVTSMDTVRLDSAVVINSARVGPNVAAAQAGRKAASERRSAARAAYLPTINAGYSRGGSGTGAYGFGANPFPYSGQLNLSLSYPLFNQFSREEQIARATVNENNAEATLRDTQLQARQLAVQYLDAVRLGEQQIAVQTATIVAAQEDLRVQQQRYNLGLSTIVDLLTAQTTLNQARVNLISARNSVRLTTAQIEALIGRTLATVHGTPPSPLAPTAPTTPNGVTPGATR
ncbi:MAG: TolC family protein [Gemmatimonadaceae bacterium]